MAALPIIADTYRIALKWQGSGSTAVNVIHIQAVTGFPNPAAVFELLQDTVTAAMWNSASSGASINEVDITPLDGTTATQNFITGGGAQWAGSNTGDFIPAAAVLVSLRTPFRGRSHRGRIFIPFTVESTSGNGFLTGSTQTTMQTAWNTFIAAVEADPDLPCQLGVASYKLATFTGVSTLTVELTLATQRRRQGRLR